MAQVHVYSRYQKNKCLAGLTPMISGIQSLIHLVYMYLSHGIPTYSTLCKYLSANHPQKISLLFTNLHHWHQHHLPSQRPLLTVYFSASRSPPVVPVSVCLWDSHLPWLWSSHSWHDQLQEAQNTAIELHVHKCAHLYYCVQIYTGLHKFMQVYTNLN